MTIHSCLTNPYDTRKTYLLPFRRSISAILPCVFPTTTELQTKHNQSINQYKHVILFVLLRIVNKINVYAIYLAVVLIFTNSRSTSPSKQNHCIRCIFSRGLFF